MCIKLLSLKYLGHQSIESKLILFSLQHASVHLFVPFFYYIYIVGFVTVKKK